MIQQMDYFQQIISIIFYNHKIKRMQYLAAYTLASLSGKEPTADQLTNILKATGQSFDQAEITKVVDSLKGKKIEDLIKAGTAKVGSVGGSSAPAKADKPAPAKKQQPKKEVKKEEPKVEEEDDFGGADLFGGDF